LDKLGLETYLDASWWFVEWPEKFLEYLAERPQLEKLLGFKDRIKIEFSMLENGERSIQFTKQLDPSLRRFS
jgi:tRNA A37 threonylcarbamoyladenosine biosynthesis protein TsaE